MGINVGVMFEPERNLENAHPENDIRLVADNLDQLDAIAALHGVATLSELGLGDDPEEIDRPEMLDPQQGIRTLKALIETLNTEPDENPEGEYPDVLIEELEELLQCLQKAEAQSARFRFTLLL